MLRMFEFRVSGARWLIGETAITSPTANLHELSTPRYFNIHPPAILPPRVDL